MIGAYQVVGIDQSLTGMGLSLIRKDNTYSTTRVKPTIRGVERLMYIEDVVNRWIPEETDLAVIEGYAMSAYGRVFDIGEAGGIIKRVVYLKGVPLIRVAPGTLKKYVTGNGNAKKNLMLLGAYKKFDVSFENDDECDAYCLARVGMEYLSAKNGRVPTAFKGTYKAILKYNNELEGGDDD